MRAILARSRSMSSAEFAACIKADIAKCEEV
jgi:hypothetical protein